MKKNFNLISIILFAALVVGVLVILGSRFSPNQSSKIQVSTSFYPLYFFSSQIAGDKANVINITPSGAEPHDYEPTTQDIVKIQNSRLLVLNGAVEAWGDKIKSNLNSSNTLVVTAGSGLLNRSLVEGGKKQIDPHVWLDPVLAKTEAEKIESALEKIDPKDASFFRSNLTALDERLDSLNQKYREGLSSCNKKDIITSHAAFGYLAQRYGLNQVAIAGISPDEEPSAKVLSDVANFAKQNGVKYIFFESLVSPKLSQTIATEIGAQTLVLDPLEGIADNDIKAGKNYFTVMQANLKNLQTALECR